MLNELENDPIVALKCYESVFYEDMNNTKKLLLILVLNTIAKSSENVCLVTNETFASILGQKVPTTSTYINELVEEGYITATYFVEDTKKRRRLTLGQKYLKMVFSEKSENTNKAISEKSENAKGNSEITENAYSEKSENAKTILQKFLKEDNKEINKEINKENINNDYSLKEFISEKSENGQFQLPSGIDCKNVVTVKNPDGIERHILVNPKYSDTWDPDGPAISLPDSKGQRETMGIDLDNPF